MKKTPFYDITDEESVGSHAVPERPKAVQEHFQNYWNEFLSISVEPTLAATQTFQLIAGHAEQKQLLKSKQDAVALIQQDLVELILNPATPHESLVQSINQYAVTFFSELYALNKLFLTSPSIIPSEESPCIEWNPLIKFYDKLWNILDCPELESTANLIIEAIQKLLEKLQEHLSINPESFVAPHQLRFFLILLICPVYDAYPTTSRNVLCRLNRLHTYMSSRNKETLLQWYKTMPSSALRQLVSTVQQFITLSILGANSTGIIGLRDTECFKLKHAFGVLKVIFEANRLRNIHLLTSLSTPALLYNINMNLNSEDVDEALTPLAISEFYNDAINAAGPLIRFDFTQWKQGDALDFDLIGHSFLLDAATKAWYLFNHSVLNQELLGRDSITRFFGPTWIQPYLVLRVRRSDIVHDALRKLTSTVTAADLGKQLKVVFDEEEAVDEGGVTKEFFQLLVEQLFNPEYGMFTYVPESRVFWFDRRSLEINLQFELIGVVLGLAIYNGVILDIHFPLAVYKKLLNYPVGLCDVEDLDPDLGRSLRKLLLVPENEVGSLCLTFSVDVVTFGISETIPLSTEYSVDTTVTAENRAVYVAEYVDWTLNRSIKPQFDAFYRGFMKCCGEEIHRLAFQPDELLLVVCGSSDFDFESLEKVTKYRDGYTGSEQTIRDFWDVVHNLSTNDKKKLLFFVTGSDRIPVKGLSSLQFFIGRAGGEVDRIPTAHTCFNYLLLPDYKDKSKLEKYLAIALSHHKGFGLR